jgi:TetR/AcrR family transcriptional repressor of mexJK operon
LEALEARIVLAARQAFVLHGYGATSVNTIAKFARVSKNTFYARFPSKAALFRAIVARQVASTQEELIPSFGGPDEQLEERLRTYLNVALRRSLGGDVLEINRLIVSESPQFPELGEAARGRFRAGVEHVTQIIEEGAGRDRIPCRNPGSAAEMLLSQVYGWYTMVMITNRVVTDRERASWVDDALRIFMASRSAW